MARKPNSESELPAEKRSLAFDTSTSAPCALDRRSDSQDVTGHPSNVDPILINPVC